MELAAHVDCKIEHSFADLGQMIGGGVGLGVGIIVGVVVGSGTAGVGGVVVGAAITSFGAWLGEKIGSWATSEDSGHIAKGAKRTFYGSLQKPAAHMECRTACFSPGMSIAEPLASTVGIVLMPTVALFGLARGVSRSWTLLQMEMAGEEILPTDDDYGAHPGSKVAFGSSTVFVETWPAARKGDAIMPCKGKIATGIESILIGGETCAHPDATNMSEVDTGQKLVVTGIEFVGFLAGLGVSAALNALKFGLFVTGQIGDYSGNRWLKGAAETGSVAVGIVEAVKTGKVPPELAIEIAKYGGEYLPGWLLPADPPPPAYVYDPATGRVRPR